LVQRPFASFFSYGAVSYLHTGSYGIKNYVRLNHLGNVQVVISDKRVSICDEYLGVERFEAEVLSAVDYYPFGMMMPDRQYYASNDSSNYRFGFNGVERENQITGQGNNLDFGARFCDSRLGRWFSLDPYQKIYPALSPYHQSGNNPIFFLDNGGKYLYACTEKTKDLVLKSMASVFGANHGFSFDEGDKLIYQDKGAPLTTYQQYLLRIFLYDVVLNAHSHVYLKEEGYPEGISKSGAFQHYYEPYFFPLGEDVPNVPYALAYFGGKGIAYGYRDKNDLILSSTIYVSGTGFLAPENPVLYLSPEQIFWHEIGNHLTNKKYNSFNTADKNIGRLGPSNGNEITIIKERQTVGFERFVQSIMGHNQLRGGQAHGDLKVQGSSGYDDFYINEASGNNKIVTNNHAGSGMFLIEKEQNIVNRIE